MPTKIEWAQESWNPITGCSKVSAGCRNCYAERMARRLAGRHGYPPAPNHFDVTLRPERLGQPLKWKKPRTVFVCSMSDLFHEDVHYSYIYNVWRIMTNCQAHTFIVLTKRAGRMSKIVNGLISSGEFSVAPNIWGLVSVEDQDQTWRIDELMKSPFVVRGVSVEPMLGLMDLRRYLWCLDCEEEAAPCEPCLKSGQYDGPKLDWVIAGGESGPGARPTHPDNFRSLRDQCQAAGVAYFFKGWGAWKPYPNDGRFGPVPSKRVHWFGKVEGPPDMWYIGKKAAGRLLDGREHNGWPEVGNV